MKGDLGLYMYLMLVVIIGILLVIIIGSKLTPLDSPEGRSKELAMLTAIHIDALSSVETGNLRLDTGKNKYDVEIQRWSGFWRGVGSAITPYVPLVPDTNPNGNYVVVTPYDKDGKKSEYSSVFFINSYDTEKDYYTKIEGTSSVCLTKDSKEKVARLVKCP